MLQIIRDLIPSRIRKGRLGDVVRFFRNKEQSGNVVHTSAQPTQSSSLNTEEESVEEPIEYDVEIRPLQLQDWISRKRQFVLIDIREPNELQHGFCEGSWLIPMNDIPTEILQLPTDQDLVIVCAAGMRSWSVSQYLRQQGYDAWSLENGVASWTDQGWKQPSLGRFPLGTRVKIDATYLENDSVITEYGFVSMVEKVDDETVYDVRFWGTDEPILVSKVPENKIERFTI
jgi:rhodanese-related sulfurtransferase